MASYQHQVFISYSDARQIDEARDSIRFEDLVAL